MTQIEEFELALKENRQPNCVRCQKPLDEVCQYQPTYLYWLWVPESNRYRKVDELGDSDKPYHTACDLPDWDLVESGEATAKLGLDY